MLQSRPSSASGSFQNAPQGQSHQASARSAPLSRNVYNGMIGGMGAAGYRGQAPLSPVAPYAFTSTPILTASNSGPRQNQQSPHLRQEQRTFSAPGNPYSQQNPNGQGAARPRYVQTSAPNSPVYHGHGQQFVSKDDSAIMTPSRHVDASNRPASTIGLSNIPSDAQFQSQTKQFPDRYRRNNRRAETNTPPSNTQRVGSPNTSAMPSGSGMVAVGHLYNHPSQAQSSPTLHTYQSPGPANPQSVRNNGFTYSGQLRATSVDDMHLYRQPASDQGKRYHRRSISSLGSAELGGPANDNRNQVMTQQRHATPSPVATSRQDHRDPTPSPPIVRPGSSHGRQSSAESASSSHSNSRASSIKREPMVPASLSATTSSQTASTSQDIKTVNVPARGSSDPNKRLAHPSPLSKPVPMSPEATSFKESFATPQPSKPTEPTPAVTQTTQAGVPESPAAQRLAALNEKEAKKGVKSRLKRAFSFGSAAELRRASAENNMNNSISAERAKLRKDRYHNDNEAEQAAIAQKQEAAGIGEGIYSGQGHFFAGSTDNLSISSTASSASVMIRKMGKGMKKSTRSLAGLFRPKSVTGIPAAEGPVPEASVGQVSMVTVEAEREKVNVNANPHEQTGGGTGFPKLERNSMDAASAAGNEGRGNSGESNGSDLRARKSIVGGEKERSEVLAAVKKGILKRTGTDSGSSSPVVKPVDSKGTDFNLPRIPHVNDSPSPSSPSTPVEDQPHRAGHRRTDSVTIEGEDYFMSIPSFSNGSSKSAPNTPQSLARNISFSPRIQFHDTWPSGEYDRRGEIATCNRLTPMLAQQIKEELNTFKMEMEVHEQSKVYTHFF
ncbi:MAG: hypothetical protein M1819_006252 [Sarea resinae]|nr:MAG: hypothetical protein M1819_006252 [Sarea resinae]